MNPIRPTLRASALLLLGAALIAPLASASVVQTGARLDIHRGFGQGSDPLKVEVDPSGGVIVYGVQDVADGSAYSGVREIAILNTAPNGSIEMRILSADIAVHFDTYNTSDSIKIEMATPQSATTAAARFHFDTNAGSDTVEMKIESFARALRLDIDLDTSSGNDQVKLELEQKVAGRVALDLNGDTSAGDDQVEVSAKGEGSLFVVNGHLTSDSLKVGIEGNVAGDLALIGEAFDNSVEFFIKGTLNGSPSIFGGFWHDSVKLIAEQGVVGGAPSIDGGQGQDSCERSQGVVMINCSP